MSALNASPQGSQQRMVSGTELEPRSCSERAPVRSGVGGVSVLFVMKDSIYKSLADDCYDEQRDALTYRGDNPVVAHPPCQLWGKMANVNYARWGGEHNRPGNDGGKFAFALDTVNRCGGVLEHPADSYAWKAHGLVRPLRGPRWYPSGQGWVCEVWQSAYGHRARKRTWLYFFGTEYQPVNPRWDMPEGTHQVGFHDQRGKARNKPTLSRREANATPESFAIFLLALANTARCRRSTNASPVSRAGHPATLSSGGGGAEQVGDGAATKQSGACSANTLLRPFCECGNKATIKRGNSKICQRCADIDGKAQPLVAGKRRFWGAPSQREYSVTLGGWK